MTLIFLFCLFYSQLAMGAKTNFTLLDCPGCNGSPCLLAPTSSKGVFVFVSCSCISVEGEERCGVSCAGRRVDRATVKSCVSNPFCHKNRNRGAGYAAAFIIFFVIAVLYIIGWTGLLYYKQRRQRQVVDHLDTSEVEIEIEENPTPLCFWGPFVAIDKKIVLAGILVLGVILSFMMGFGIAAVTVSVPEEVCLGG